MPYFPQLFTGAAAQFPLTRRQSRRTVASQLHDGTVVKLGDPDLARVEWELVLEDLTDAEWNAVAALFEEVEGRLGTFVFPDPADNLLRWSEELDEGAWQRDPWLGAAAGVADPLGTLRATRLTNVGQSRQGIRQELDAPGWWHCCFSLYARSGTGSEVVLRRFTEIDAQERRHALDANWQRLHSSGRLEGPGNVRFSIDVEAGSVVEVFGCQVEAQPLPSAYRKTQSRSGLYRKARFGDDQLAVRTAGEGRHGCAIRIMSSLEE